MAEGNTNRAITGRMFVTERAVERHVTSIFEKLDLVAGETGHRRVLAVLAYLRDRAHRTRPPHAPIGRVRQVAWCECASGTSPLR